MAGKGENRSRVAGVVLGALCLTPALAGAACAVCEASIQHYTTAQGLSHNAVVAMAQDQDRFVWLATRDGLDRLDGAQVSRYETLAGQSLRADSMTSLAVGEAGELWIGLRTHVLRRRVDGQVLAVELRHAGSESRSSTLLRSDHGDAWVGTTDGLLHVVSGDPLRLVDIDAFRGEQVLGMQQAAAGWQVISRRDGCWLRSIGSDGAVSGPAPAPCWASWIDADGAWLGDLGIFWKPGDPLPASDPDRGVPSRVLRWQGGYLLAGLSGAFWQSPSGEVHSLWPGLRTGLGRSPSEESLDALIDADGALWLATYAGAHRFDLGAPAFSGLDGGSLDRSLERRAVSDVEFFAGRLWVGSFGHGLLGWDRSNDDIRSWRGEHASALWRKQCGDYVWDLLALPERTGPGRLLVNARCALDETLALQTLAGPELPEASRASLVSSDGRVWVASIDGLYEIIAGGVWRRQPGRFEALVEAPDGAIWLAPAIHADGPADPFLTVYAPQTEAVRQVALPVGTAVHDMVFHRGVLWAASSDGLLRIDAQSGEVISHRAPLADAGRVFYSLFDDGLGAIWIGTNRGLLRFDPRREPAEQFRLYDQRDGVGVQEFNRRSHARTAERTLLLGGMGGVVGFDPQRAAAAPDPPEPRVVAAHVWSAGGSERRLELARGSPVRLNADDVSVTLEFVAPGFRRAGHVRFRYRLQGVDGAWVDDVGARSARYPRLAPGDYSFELQSGFEDSTWRSASAPLLLTFLPAWHESAWFRLPAALVLGLLGWLLYRWRVQRLLEVERLRTRIAADLHDELGSELAAIGMSTAMLASRGGMPERERQRLVGVAASAQQVADAMRDIVWYVNPHKDRMRALGERLHALARRVLGDGVALEVADGFAELDAGLPMMARRELHLICREAFANIARHAGADTVSLRLERSGDRLTIIIEDNGRGFDATQPGDINGLANMRRRAEAIGAELEIDSSPGQGTRVILRWQQRRGAAVRVWGRR